MNPSNVYVDIIKTALNEYLDRAILEHRAIQDTGDKTLQSIKHSPIQIQACLSMLDMLGRFDASTLTDIMAKMGDGDDT